MDINRYIFFPFCMDFFHIKIMFFASKKYKYKPACTFAKSITCIRSYLQYLEADEDQNILPRQLI